MKKRKQKQVAIKRQHLSAKWEILKTAEFVIEHFGDKPLPSHVLPHIYKGAAVPAILNGVIDSEQKWGVTIETVVQDDNGTEYPPHIVSWSIDEPLSFKDFMNGSDQVKVNRGGGLKTRWLGVGKEWIKMVDEDLSGLIAKTAWATANCLAKIKG